MAVTARRPFANGLEILANYTWAKATDTGQVGGANGTFYGGDTPLDPNNTRRDNGPSDTDIRNRFTLSFVYQPQIMEGNKIVKQVVDGFTFSGGEIASGGQPIFLGMSGTVYSGSTSATSYGADGNIYGGAMSSSSGAATTGRPPQIGRGSLYGPGFNNFDLRVARNIPIHEKIYMQVTADAFNVLNHTIVTSVNGTYSHLPCSRRNRLRVQVQQTTTAPTGSTAAGLHRALQPARASRPSVQLQEPTTACMARARCSSPRSCSSKPAPKQKARIAHSAQSGLFCLPMSPVRRSPVSHPTASP